MSALREMPTTEVTRMPTRRSYVFELIFGIAGVLAAGVGAWMYYVPADWFLGGLVEGWYFGMFIAAGVLLAGAFGLFARMAYVDDRDYTTRVVVPTVAALAALAGAITFAVILII
jgi:predicted outer membrane lipoprotein